MSYTPENEDPATGSKQDEIIAGVDENTAAVDSATAAIDSVIQEEGAVDKVRIQALDNDALLRGILKELKKMNFYLSHMSDIDDGVGINSK